MTKTALRLILALATIPALVGLASRPLSAQSGAGRAMAPKGKPTPRTEDGKVDFSGVYSPPGRAPGDGRVATRCACMDLTMAPRWRPVIAGSAPRRHPPARVPIDRYPQPGTPASTTRRVPLAPQTAPPRPRRESGP